MRTLLFFFLTVILFFSRSFGQTNPNDKQIMDSLLQNDEALKMFNSYNKPTSYFRINIGAGNKLYSSQNNAIESLQSNNPLVISPTVAYYHKSGLGISATGFLLNENNKTDFYQYSVSPFYNYTKGKIARASLSYTHYFEKDIYSPHTSPIQNEFYGSFVFKKPWLQPGISAGYSSGTYHEIINIDTIVRVANQRVHIKYIDSITARISSFSVAGTLEHSFIFYKIFSGKDGVIFVPQFSFITGINTFHVSHRSTIANYNSFTKKLSKRIRHFQSQESNNAKYEAQSIGLDLDLNYSIGIFYVEPELYLDYYLPKTNDTRFTQIFNVNIGITF
ncbi:MAG: hypothetical protein ABI863_12490 [Ginsengibacter sp.]